MYNLLMSKDLSFLQLAHKQNRIAVISIDIQYLFQNFGSFTEQQKQSYKKFNEDCAVALEAYRSMGIPIIHVAFDLKHPNVGFHVVRSQEQKEELSRNTQTYSYNKENLCVDTRCTDRLEIDLIHPAKNNEAIVLKTNSSAFETDILHQYLQSKKLDELLFIGMYTKDCITNSMRGADTLGYHVYGLADLIEDDRPKQDTISRLDENLDFLKYAIPNAIITNHANVVNELNSLKL